MLDERARAGGLTLSEWVRDVLLAPSVDPGAEAGNEVVLAELLALRSLFLNLRVRSHKGCADGVGAPWPDRASGCNEVGTGAGAPASRSRGQ
jgi:hypothetical protein